jgi:hypothetical protein
MLKLSICTVLVAGLLAATPSFADSKDGNSGIGRGCTLNPFNHTMRCIDFDHCTTDKNGHRVCPTTTTPTRKVAEQGKTKGRKGEVKDETQDYLVVTLHDASIMAS